MRSFEVRNLAAIRGALDDHNRSCPVPATSILLNPIDHGLMGWDTLWGLPVVPDSRVQTKRVRIGCDGSAWTAEEELETLVADSPAGAALLCSLASDAG